MKQLAERSLVYLLHRLYAATLVNSALHLASGIRNWHELTKALIVLIGVLLMKWHCICSLRILSSGRLRFMCRCSCWHFWRSGRRSSSNLWPKAPTATSSSIIRGCSSSCQNSVQGKNKNCNSCSCNDWMIYLRQ